MVGRGASGGVERFAGACAEWRREFVSAIQSFTSPTVIFTHFLVINAVAAHISGEDRVVQCLPANASVHELSTDGRDWQWRARGAMLNSVVN